MPGNTTTTTPGRALIDVRHLEVAQKAHANLREAYGLPEKPTWRDVCNHCGLCCMMSLCPAAKVLHPTAEAPCQHLVLADGKALCGLVLKERDKGMLPLVELSLAVGCGCSMGDQDTTVAELDAWDAEVQRLLAPRVRQVAEEFQREANAKRRP